MSPIAITVAPTINLQTVSVGVDAANWQFYKSGIFADCGKNLDHGVLAVGKTLLEAFDRLEVFEASAKLTYGGVSTVHDLRQVKTLHILHGKKPVPVGFIEIVDSDDVFVIQPGGDPRFV